MAIYHANIQSFSRGKGESSLAAAAYRAGLDLVDTHSRVRHDYTRRTGVVAYEMLAPDGAPAWCFDPIVFWDANECHETRKNARVARELEVSLPHELSRDQRHSLAATLAQMLVKRYQCAVLMAIHAPGGAGDQRNHHVHLLMSARQVGPEGLGERAGSEFDATKGRGALEIVAVRKLVADTINVHLAMAAFPARVDHRRLKVQAEEAKAAGDLARAAELDRQPTQHVGKTRTALARKAADTQAKRDWDAAIEMAKASGRFVATPEAHSHTRALAERTHEPRPSAMDALNFQSHWQGEGWYPRSQVDLTVSPVARHLSRVAHIARLRGETEDCLDGERDLVKAWCASIAEMAQEAFQKVQLLSITIEVQFKRAIDAILVSRVEVHGAKPYFFEDTELFSNLIRDYSRAVRTPVIKEDIKRQAEVDLSQIEREAKSPRSREVLSARRALHAARRSTTAHAKERDRKRIFATLDALNCARIDYESKYFISGADGPSEEATLQDAFREAVDTTMNAGGSAGGQSGMGTLGMRPRPGLFGSIGRRV